MQGRWEAQLPRRQGRGPSRPRAPGTRTPPGQAYEHEGSKAATLEEAEATLVGRCVKEALYIHYQFQESASRRTLLGIEAARQDAPAQEVEQLTAAWEEANTDCWRLQENARKLDLNHMDQARKLRAAFGGDPDQAPDTAAARRAELDRRQKETNQADTALAADIRKLERLRKQTTEEIDAQRARLAAQEQELRQQSADADKQEAEAAVVSAHKAFHLKKVRAEQEEVEAHWNTLKEDIAKDEADGRAKDAEARRRAFACADE